VLLELGMQGMLLHPIVKNFWAKLIRFGQIWLDKIWEKTETKFGQKRLDFGKFDWIWAK